MDDRIRQALASDRTIDITTTGRTSGLPRRIETWVYRVDDRFFLTGSPGRRDWYANLLANPDFTFHLKQSVATDLPAQAAPITDPHLSGSQPGRDLSADRAQSVEHPFAVNRRSAHRLGPLEVQ